MKKTGVKIAAKEAKKVVRAAVKQEVKKEERKVHKKGGPKPKKAMKSVISSSMRGQKTYNAPVSVGMSTRSYFQVKNLTSGKYKGGVRVTGRDYFSTASWLTSSAVGSALVNLPLNPSALDGTRLAQFTVLYEKYRFNRFKVYALPTASTSTSGAYGMSYDRDPSDVTPATGEPGIREYMSFEGSTTASAWLQSELDAPLMEPTTDYFVNAVSGGDERLVDQGQFYLWVYTACSANTSIALEIEYDLTLYVPQTTGSVGSTLQIASTTATTKNPPSTVTATNGWNPLNTLKTGNSGYWGAISQVGDIAKILGVPSATADYYVEVAGGLYTIYQELSGIANATFIAGSYYFNPPTFVANKAEEQSLYTTDSIHVLTGVSQGSPNTALHTAALDNIFVPPGGGRLYGSFGSDIGTWNSITLLSAILTLSIGPCFSSCSPADLFTPMLGKPGKFGDKHRQKFREYQAQRPPRVELASRVRDIPRGPDSIPSTAIAPLDGSSETEKARAEAIQAAAKLLGIK